MLADDHLLCCSFEQKGARQRVAVVALCTLLTLLIMQGQQYVVNSVIHPMLLEELPRMPATSQSLTMANTSSCQKRIVS